MNKIKAEIRQLKAKDRNCCWLIQAINNPSVQWTEIVRRINDADLNDLMEKFMRSNGDEECKERFINHCENMRRECIKGIVERENKVTEMRKKILEDSEAQKYYSHFMENYK